MSYNPFPQPADVIVISAGSSVSQNNRFPVGIGTTGFVALNYSGNPVTFSNPLPVSLGSSNITITGNVNVGTTVSVTSSPENPVHNHITEVGTSDILTTPYLPVGVGTVNLNLSYLPVGISSLLNLVSISNTAFYVKNNGSTVSETNRFPVSIGQTTVSVTGIVSVSNTIPVSIGGTTTITTQVSAFPDSSLAAFEELMVVQPFPIIQVDSVYGIETDKIATTQIGTGSCFADTDRVWNITSGITTGSAASLGSKRFVRYRPGTGTLARFTALFTTTGITTTGVGLGVTNVSQQAGLYNPGNSYSFGFSGIETANKFGVLHRYNGKIEIRKLDITREPTGIQTATLILNGTTYSIPIGAGTTQQTAAAIAAYNYGNIWNTDQVGGSVVFSARTTGVRSGAYSFSASGAGTTATGTITQVTAGQANTNVWTYQDQWNGTPVSIDPSKLNVYSIDMRWLGAGAVRFFIENPENGKMTLVHTQLWSNRNTIPHLSNPSMRVGYAAGVLAAPPSQAAIVKGASLYGSIQGSLTQTTFSEGWYAVNSNSLAKDIVHHIMSIKNPYTSTDRLNTRELILQDLSVSVQGTDPVVVFVYKNPIIATGEILFDTIPESNALVSTIDVPTFDPSLNNPIVSFVLGINGTSQFDLLPYRIEISPGDYISIAVLSTNSISRNALSLTWSTD